MLPNEAYTVISLVLCTTPVLSLTGYALVYMYKFFSQFQTAHFPRPSHHSSSPSSNVSTLSTSSISLEDSPLSQSLPGSVTPALKRTKSREFPKPPVKKVTHQVLLQDFKLPSSANVRESVQLNISLDEATRRELIRETVTCVSAHVGVSVIPKHFEEVAKQLFEKVALLKDEKPPLWPEEVEFPY